MNRDGIVGAALLLCALVAAGCRQDMHDQPVYEADEAGPFFADGRASRPAVEGTVARDDPPAGAPEVTGKRDGVFLVQLPLPIGAGLVTRGRQRYDIFCSPCHDRVGTGQGMIVLRGYPPPPSLHEPRLRAAADGYLFDVIGRGFGLMPAYGPQIPVRDRWAIVAYLRALQLSQNAPLSVLPPEERQRLGAEP